MVQVVNMSLAASLTAAGLLLLKRAVGKRFPPSLYCLLWLLVLLRLAVPVWASSPSSVWNLVEPLRVEETAVPAFSQMVLVEETQRQVGFPMLLEWKMGGVSILPLSLMYLLTIVWLAGIGALTLYSLVCYGTILRRIKNGYRCDESEQVKRLKALLGLKRKVEIYYCDQFVSPVTCGILRPKIVLPYTFDPDDKQAEHILLHELVHIKRNDSLTRLVSVGLLYLNWFNPFLWYCYERGAADLEAACDSRVLSLLGGDHRQEYAHSLVAMAAEQSPFSGGVLAFGECGLKERVNYIMSYKKLTVVSIVLCLAVFAAFGFIFLTNPQTIPTVQPGMEETEQTPPIQVEQEQDKEPAEPPKQEPAEPTQPETPTVPAVTPTEPKSEDSAEEPLPFKDVAWMEWRKQENDHVSITVIQEEGDVKTLLAELEAFDFQPDENASLVNVDDKSGLVLYNSKNENLGTLFILPKRDETTHVIYTDSEEKGYYWASDRNPDLYENILASLYDRWAQKYPALWYQDEAISTIQLLNNDLHTSILLDTKEDVESLNKAIRHLVTSAPQSACADSGKNLNREVRVYFKDGTMSRIQLYEKAVAVSISGDGVLADHRPQTWFTCTADTLQTLLDRVAEQESSKDAHLAWLTIMNKDRMTHLFSNEKYTDADQEDEIFNLLTDLVVDPSSVKETMDCLDNATYTIRVSFETVGNVEYRVELNETQISLVIWGDDFTGGVQAKVKNSAELLKLMDSFETPVDKDKNVPAMKPVIYLYPTQRQDVHVELGLDGYLTVTDPVYGADGWMVTADPDGALVNHWDGRTYPYLFWEANLKGTWNITEGSVVPAAETEAFLKNILIQMGMIPQEYEEFLEYWVPKLEENPYNLIAFIGEEYDQRAKLMVTPQPDSVLRVFMAVHPVSDPAEYKDLPAQTFQHFQRSGFTVVEWGGGMF